jgi:hypothetical protein
VHIVLGFYEAAKHLLLHAVGPDHPDTARVLVCIGAVHMDFEE